MVIGSAVRTRVCHLMDSMPTLTGISNSAASKYGQVSAGHSTKLTPLAACVLICEYRFQNSKTVTSMPAVYFSAIAVVLFKMKPSVMQPHVILGIDPGTLFMGYGLIAVNKNSVTLVEMGVLRLAREKDHAE